MHPMLGRLLSMAAAAAAAVAVLAAAGATTASAKENAFVSPASVAVGGTITVAGVCDSDGITAYSDAFAGSGQEFAGVPALFGPVTNGSFTLTWTIQPQVAPGTYSIGFRCGGGNLGVSLSLQVVAGGLVASGSPWLGQEVLSGVVLIGVGLIGAVVARRRRPLRA